MRMPVIAMLCLLSRGALALGDWVWIDTAHTSGIAAASMAISDRDDLRDLERAGISIPSALPALIHVPSRSIAIRPASVAAGKAACIASAAQAMGVTGAVADWRSACSNAAAITGGRGDLRGLKGRGKTMSSTARQAYYAAAIDALIARVEMLEASMRRAGITVPDDLTEDPQ